MKIERYFVPQNEPKKGMIKPIFRSLFVLCILRSAIARPADVAASVLFALVHPILNRLPSPQTSLFAFCHLGRATKKQTKIGPDQAKKLNQTLIYHHSSGHFPSNKALFKGIQPDSIPFKHSREKNRKPLSSQPRRLSGQFIGQIRKKRLKNRLKFAAKKCGFRAHPSTLNSPPSQHLKIRNPPLVPPQSTRKTLVHNRLNNSTLPANCPGYDQ